MFLQNKEILGPKATSTWGCPHPVGVIKGIQTPNSKTPHSVEPRHRAILTIVWVEDAPRKAPPTCVWLNTKHSRLVSVHLLGGTQTVS